MSRLKHNSNMIELLKKDLQGEYDAINMYQKHIDTIDNPEIKAKLTEIMNEEKHHVDELTELLNKHGV